MTRPMLKIMLAVAAVSILAATFASPEASARSRIKVVRFIRVIDLDRGLAASDFCGGRLPGYGSDACGYREVSYGPNSCWRRLPYRPHGPQPRLIFVCR